MVDELSAERNIGDPSPRLAFTEAEFVAWGRKNSLPEISPAFMLELRTAIDPITTNELRFADLIVCDVRQIGVREMGDYQISSGMVSRTREEEAEGAPRRDVEVDAALRAMLWYGSQALWLLNPSDEIKGFIKRLEPHRIGSIYDARDFGGCPVDLPTINTVEDLVKWAALPIGKLALESDALPLSGPRMTYRRALVVCGNGDESEAVSQLCRECALVAAGFRVAHNGAEWRVPPEIDIREDIFGRKTVSFYARLRALEVAGVS